MGMDLRERIVEYGGPEALEEVIRSAIDARLRNLWTVLPTRLVEDSDGKTVEAKSSIQSQERDEDGKPRHVDLPQFAQVPIQFSSGGGITYTYPLKEKDEGLTIFASRAVAAWREEGGVQKPVDLRSHSLSDGFYVPGVRPKPRDLSDINTEAAEARSDDGKHRGITHPKNGIKTSVDNGRQVIDVNAKTGQVEVKSPTVALAAGAPQPGRAPNTPNTVDRDLNEALKGALARLGQLEKSHAGAFDIVSKLRENMEKVVPALVPLNAATQVSAVLNGAPGGLDAMVALVEGKAQAYLQTQIQQALGMFMNPTIGAVASVLGGGIEGQIEALKGQIASLVAANPVVAQVEGLQRQVDAVLARGASAAVEAAQLKPIQDQIEALAKANPIVGTVQGLQQQLQKLIGLAGPGLNFLEPQKRLAEGKIKSLFLSEG